MNTDVDATEFLDCARYGIKLAEQVREWEVRDNLLELVRIWMGAARDSKQLASRQGECAS